MDVYFKIKALAEIGVQIILHSFVYNRPPAKELEALCEEYHYYDRLPPMRSLPIGKPHIVSSRQHEALLGRLLEDDIPILFEGLHSTHYLGNPGFARRKLLVRTHNVEWEYYAGLAARETSAWKRQYFLAESRELRRWEHVLHYADHILPISPKDTAYYEARFEGVTYLPAFHAHDAVQSLLGRGEYCLYHGNLSVSENEEAALFLIREVFNELTIPLIIAGSHPSPGLIEAISEHDHMTLRHDPSTSEMDTLLREAHLHVLPTFQPTGIKLKLLTSLHLGRFVLANEPMVLGTGLEFGTRICRDAAEFRRTIEELWTQDFRNIDLAQREAALGSTFSVADNALLLCDIIRSPMSP